MACGKMMNLEEENPRECLAFELFKIHNTISDLRNRIKYLEILNERRAILELKTELKKRK